MAGAAPLAGIIVLGRYGAVLLVAYWALIVLTVAATFSLVNAPKILRYADFPPFLPGDIRVGPVVALGLAVNLAAAIYVLIAM
jgi:hypothetical protein